MSLHAILQRLYAKHVKSLYDIVGTYNPDWAKVRNADPTDLPVLMLEKNLAEWVARRLNNTLDNPETLFQIMKDRTYEVRDLIPPFERISRLFEFIGDRAMAKKAAAYAKTFKQGDPQ